MRGDLREVVIAALTASRDNPEQALGRIIKTAIADKQMAKTLIYLGAKQALRSYFSQQRESAISTAAGRIAANLENPDIELRVSSRLARTAFWEKYTLFGMRPIGDATKEMLIESAESREAQAAGEIRLAKFERAVAARLTRGEIVRHAMSLAQIEKLAAKYVGR